METPNKGELLRGSPQMSSPATPHLPSPKAKRSGVRALPHLCRRPVLAATKSCTRLGKETGAGASTTTTVLGTWAQLSGFELATTYEWWAQARNQYVVSDPSEVCTFTTP